MKAILLSAAAGLLLFALITVCLRALNAEFGAIAGNSILGRSSIANLHSFDYAARSRLP